MTDRIEQILRDYLKPEHFGLGERFRHTITFRDDAYFFDDFDRLDPEHYDCKPGAILAQKKLKEYGIETEICTGQDELGIFNIHFFLRTPDETIIDPTPMFQTIGAKHIANAYHNFLNSKTAAYILNSLIEEENSIPLAEGACIRFYDHGEKTYLTNLRAEPIIDDGEPDSMMARIIHDTTQLLNGIPQYALRYEIILDISEYLKIKDNFDMDSIERINDLGKSYVGRGELSGIKLDYKGHGLIECNRYQHMLLPELEDLWVQESNLIVEFTKNVLKSHH
ncbi:hypothetical protein HOC35_01595 [Candidatus Woesearchaeota archaeon]|jgi:hypothetical protein|nr:hypothetical protein [Candidatus Woesearchaeota archaeon]